MKPQVDSKKQKLNVYEIIQHALENQDFSNPYTKDPKVAYLAVLSEMSQPNTTVKQIGNTLWIAHQKGDVASVKALNADTAENMMDGVMIFGDVLEKELGVKTAIATYKGATFRNIIKATVMKRNDPRYGYQIRKSKNGNDVAIMQLKD